MALGNLEIIKRNTIPKDMKDDATTTFRRILNGNSHLKYFLEKIMTKMKFIM